MEIPKISIIIPVYNIPEKYLRNCLNSIINQTEECIEVIVVDDGSKDNSGKICDEFATIDERIHVFHTVNAGVSNARNIGISNALAEFLIFVDADDYLVPDTCEKCYEIASKHGEDIIFFRPVSSYQDTFEYVKKGSDFVRKMQTDIIAHTDTYDGFVFGSPWGKIFRRDFLKEQSLLFTLGVKRSQDRLFMIQCLDKTDSVGLYYYSAYNYVKNEESICNKYNPNIVDILQNSYAHIEYFVNKNHFQEKDFQDALMYLEFKFFFTELQLYYLNRKRNIGLISTAKDIKKLFVDLKYAEKLEQIDINYFTGKSGIIYRLLKRRMYFLTVFVYRVIDYWVMVRDYFRR